MVKGVNGINQTSTLLVTGTHTRGEDEGRRMLRMCDVAHVMTFFQEIQETVHGPGTNFVDKSLELRSLVICFVSFASSLCCQIRWVEDGLRFESEHKHVQTTMVDCRGVLRFVLQDAMKVNDHTEETRSCTLRVQRSFEDLVQCSTL